MSMRFYRFFLVSSLLLMAHLGAGCRIFKSFSEVQGNSGGGGDTAVLGQGYDSVARKLLNNVCVTGTPVVVGNATGEINYTENMTYDSLLNKLDNTLLGSGKVPLSSGSVTAQLALDSSSDQRSETHMVYWIGVNRKKVLDGHSYALTNIGTQYARDDKAHLQGRCGNEFVAELQYGASIFATMKIEYLNTSDKFQAGGSVKVDLGAGIIKLDASANKLDQELKKRTKVSLLVKQLGGDPTGLMRILPADAITCSMDDIAPCMEAFDAVVSYMRGDFKKNLEQSADQADAWNVLKFVTVPYDSAGLEEMIPPGGFTQMDFVALTKRRALEDRYTAELFNANRAQMLMQTAQAAAYLSDNAIASLQGIYTVASANVDTLQQALVQCQDAVAQCAALSDQVLAMLPVYDIGPLSLDIGQKRAVGNIYYYNILGGYLTGGKYDDTAAGGSNARIVRIDLHAITSKSLGAQGLLTGMRLVYANGVQVIHGKLNAGTVQSIDLKTDTVASFQVCPNSTENSTSLRVEGLMVTSVGGRSIAAGNITSNKCTTIALPANETFIGMAGSSGTLVDSLGIITRAF